MRITADAKRETRQQILKVAQRMFRQRGFAEAKIRDIATEVGIATGTLFNYFASKEEVAVCLAENALEDARRQFAKKRRDGASLSEDLFLHVATQLRAMRGIRKFIQPVLHTGLAAAFSHDKEAQPDIVAAQLHAVGTIVERHQVTADRWSSAAPIYWALYIGVLSYWQSDKSPKQEDTLAMLDQATNMFVSWLESGALTSERGAQP